MGNPFLMDEHEFNLKTHSRGTGMNHTTWVSASGKTIHFIRHAQAAHNVNGDHSIPDPRLTAEGVRQAQRLKDGMPADALAHIELIVSSPMRRTIQTTLLGFHTQIEWQGIPVKLLADLQETNDYPCDTGSPRDLLLGEFPALEKEIHDLPLSWYLKREENAATRDALEKRASRVLKWLLDRPEKVIAVVCHNGFLRYLIGEDLWTSSGSTPEGFKNTEVRTFTLDTQGRIKREGIRVITRNYIAEEVDAVGYLD